MADHSPQRPRVFITGGAGLLGLNWALAIRDRYSVTLGLHERNVSLAGVETLGVRLESTDEISRAFDRIEPALVIHAAGITSVEACESDPALARRGNVDLAANVARACDRAGALLVHVSTDHLFSGDTPAVTEEHPVSPRNVYARTKAEAEVRVLEACPAALVVRTNFYGWGPAWRCSFSDFILAALRERRPLTLFQDVFYTPILIEALVTTVHEIIGRKGCGIFHVVGEERLSKLQFGFRVAEQFRLDPAAIQATNLMDQVTLVQRPKDMSLSNEKARRLLGRALGGVDEQLHILRQQEELGLAREVSNA